MTKDEVKGLLFGVANSLDKTAEDIRIAITNYQNLNYADRKDCADAFKAVGESVEACVKAAGAGWWKKWGHIVFGWIIGGFLGLAMVLGIFKILFE